MYLQDTEGRMLACNPALARDLAMPPEQIIGKYGPGLVNDDIRPEIEAANRRVLAERKLVESLFEFVFPDGIYRARLVQKFPVLAANGDVEAIGTIATDVTYLKEVERRLADSEARFRSVLDHVPIGLCCSDTELRLTYANMALAKLLGTGPEALVGRSYVDAIRGCPFSYTPAQVHELEDNARRVLETGKPLTWIMDLELASDDAATARQVNLIFTKFPIYGAAGIPVALGTAIQDISAIRRSERLLQEIAEGVAGDIGEHFFVTLVRHLQSALGMTYAMVGELVAPGRIRTLAMHGPDGPMENIEFDLRGTPCQTAMERPLCVYRSGTGDLFPDDPRRLRERGIESYAGVPLRNSRGQAIGILVTLGRDVLEQPDVISDPLQIFAARAASELERLRSERQMMQSGKLAMLGQTVAGMVHELSQPLNIMKLAAEGALLKISRHEAPPDYLEKQLARIDSQSTRLAELIDHIRIFSRHDSPEGEIFNPVEPVERAMTLLEGQFAKAQIRLRYVPHATRALVRGSPVQLEQVVINLLTNARDAIVERFDTAASSDGEPIGEVAVRLDIDDQGAPDVVLRVSDNGTGIPPQNLDHIFQPFFTTKEPGRGTGLGLSVSYGIVSGMRGNLSVTSGENGSEFTVNLPCYDSEAVAGRRLRAPRFGPEGQLHDYGGLGVLLVDDEREVATTLADFLTTIGLTVRFAADPMAAVTFVEEGGAPPDILVTDLRMPGMGGFDLIRRLRRSLPDLPVVIITGNAPDDQDLGSEFDNDHTILLRKPVALGTLDAAIFTLLGGRPYRELT